MKLRIFTALCALLWVSCDRTPTGPLRQEDSVPSGTVSIQWNNLDALSAQYPFLKDATAGVVDSINSRLRPDSSYAFTIQLDTLDLNGNYNDNTIQRLRNKHRSFSAQPLIAGVIAQGGECYLDFSSPESVVECGGIDMDIHQLAADHDTKTWTLVLLHETIHVMGFGTSDEWRSMVVGDSLFLSDKTLALSGEDLDGNGHWEETGSNRLLEPYFPGVDVARVSGDTWKVLREIGWK